LSGQTEKKQAKKPSLYGMGKVFNTRDLIIRHLIILVLAAIFGFSLIVDKPSLLNVNGWLRAFSWNFLFIAFIWNGNMLLVKAGPFEKLSWENEPKRKILAALVVALIWPVLSYYLFNIYLFEPILGIPCELESKENIIFLIITVNITLLINAIMVANEFFIHWRKSTLEKEELKRITVSAEFESLKNQVNPHFLFNALNTLASLIEEEPQVASRFVQKLSSVYRYLLSQKDKELVSLGEELEFLKSYIFLYQIRFGENFKVIIDIDQQWLHKEIVTLSLQMLLENAVKHNIISKEKPLTVKIHIKGQKLCVCNNLQVKTILTESNGIGLKNIQSRYAIISNEEVEVSMSENMFLVCVPLI
jgi:two-component system, LytTR family, sensor kinase